MNGFVIYDAHLVGGDPRHRVVVQVALRASPRPAG